MKYILLICDGMADKPEKNFKTPLQSASKKNFDFLAANGINGEMLPVPKKMYPASDVAHLSILGYDLKKEYCGRGPLEALGAGLKLEEGDVAFRANIGTVDKNFKVLDRRAGRIKDSKILKKIEKAVSKINLEVPFVFKQTIEHRGVLVLKGLKGKVSNTDPHVEGKKVLKAKPLDRGKESKKLSKIINLFTKKSYEILKNLESNKKRKIPANIILLRGYGIFKKVKSFYEKYKKTGAVIAATALIKGVARYTGMKVIEVKGATGTENTNIRGKFEAAVNALKKYDFVLVNIKAADNFGHDGNFEGKKRMIENIDKQLKILIKRLDKARLAVTSDHATPVKLRDHAAGTRVLLCISGAGIKADGIKKFDEVSCKRGSLRKVQGSELMKVLLK